MPLGAGPAPSLSPHSCFRPVCLLRAGRRAEWPRRLGPARGGGWRLARSRSACGSTWLSPALRRSGGDGRQRAGRVRPAPLPVSESADICLSWKPAAARHGLCAVDSELPPRTAGPAPGEGTAQAPPPHGAVGLSARGSRGRVSRCGQRHHPICVDFSALAVTVP